MLNLSNHNIRSRKPGFSEAYYHLFESLDSVVPRILERHGMADAHTLRVLRGETNAVIGFVSAEGAFVLKLAPNDDLTAEVYWYTRVSTAALPSPHVVAHDLTKTYVPYMYTIMEWSSGQDLRGAAPSLHYPAGVAVGHYLRQLHTLGAAGFGSLSKAGTWTHTDSVAPVQDTLLTSGMTHWKDHIFSATESATVEDLLMHPSMAVPTPALLHGDVGLSNVLFHLRDRQFELVAMIDPGELIGGDPMFDLAVATNDFDAFASGVLQGYTEDRPLTAAEQQRMLVLQLCTLYWSSCWHYATNRDYTRPLKYFRTLLKKLA